MREQQKYDKATEIYRIIENDPEYKKSLEANDRNSTDSESTPKNPQNPVRNRVDFRDDPDSPPTESAFSSRENYLTTSSTFPLDASLANSYSARAHCSVISEIDTGLRNLRTCNQWESLMTSTESSELA